MPRRRARWAATSWIRRGAAPPRRPPSPRACARPRHSRRRPSRPRVTIGSHRPPFVPLAGPWVLLAGATAAAAVGFSALGLPSASLFAALLVGLIAALSVPSRIPQVPPSAFRAAQALTGVSLGVYVQSSSLHAVAS